MQDLTSLFLPWVVLTLVSLVLQAVHVVLVNTALGYQLSSRPEDYQRFTLSSLLAMLPQCYMLLCVWSAR